MGKQPEWTFLQNKYTNGQQTYEKLLNIAHHQEMQINPQGAITAHLLGWSQKAKRRVGEGGKKGDACPLLMGK